MTYTVAAFTTSVPSCTITYTMTLNTTATYDTTFVNFAASTRAMTVQTNDNTKVGTQYLIVTGTNAAGITASTAAFSLIVSH